MILIANHKLYDVLRFFTQVLLPALGTLYVSLAGLWGLPKAQEVAGTILAVTTFLGVILHLSTRAYTKTDARFDGAMVVEHKDDGGKSYSLQLNGDPDELDKQNEVIFKVHPPTTKPRVTRKRASKKPA